MYAGAVGLTSAYFAKGLGLACPPDWNPADFMMDLCVQGKLDSDKARAQIRADADKRRAALGGGGAHTSDKDAETLEEDVRQRYVKPWSYQLKVLLQREWAVRKGSLWDQNQLLLHAGIAVLGGVMWFGTAYGERDIFPRFTASFAVILQWIFFPFLDNLFVFTLAEVQLRKELRVGAYRLSSWFVAKTTAGLLPYAIWPLLHVTILYWMANVNGIGGAPFVVTMALVYLTILLFQSFSLALGAVFSPGRVMTVALLCMTAMFLFVRARDTAPSSRARARPSAAGALTRRPRLPNSPPHRAPAARARRRPACSSRSSKRRCRGSASSTRCSTACRPSSASRSAGAARTRAMTGCAWAPRSRTCARARRAR